MKMMIFHQSVRRNLGSQVQPAIIAFLAFRDRAPEHNTTFIPHIVGTNRTWLGEFPPSSLHFNLAGEKGSIFMTLTLENNMSSTQNTPGTVKPTRKRASKATKTEAEEAKDESAEVTGKGMQIHPLGALFPVADEQTLQGLTEDIHKNGLRRPIITYQGMILDGRNRYICCKRAGVEPRYEEYEGDDPLGFVLGENLHRRHLTTAQRAAIAVDIANMRQGERTDLEPCRNSGKVTQTEAAKAMGVSRDSVQAAKAIRDAAPEVFEEVRQGKKTLNAAQKEVKPKSPKPDTSSDEKPEEGTVEPPKLESGDEKHPNQECSDQMEIQSSSADNVEEAKKVSENR